MNLQTLMLEMAAQPKVTSFSIYHEKVEPIRPELIPKCLWDGKLHRLHWRMTIGNTEHRGTIDILPGSSITAAHKHLVQWVQRVFEEQS